MLELLGMQPIASAHGASIDSLIVWVHWLMLVLFVGWGSFFVMTLFKFRSSANPKADPVGVKSHFSSYIELLVAGIEVVLLIGFSIPIWAEAVSAFPEENEATVVMVTAEQFAWNFHYAGPDGKFGKVESKFVTAGANPLGLDPSDPNGKDDFNSINQLVVPNNKPVITKIASKDVIHSFGIPSMRIKQDAIPGMQVPIWFKPIKEGTYEIACSQLCGIGHYSMRGFIVVKSDADFNKWYTEKTAVQTQSGEEVW